MFEQTTFRSLTLAAVLAGLIAYASFGGFFAREIVIEIAILAILAISLDVVAGFGGMVSLCHGAILGLSAYAYGVLTVKFGLPPMPAAAAAVFAAATAAAAIGWITARTTGIYFIMATLAFGQMAYTLIFTSRWLGGDDGMAGLTRFDLTQIGVNLEKSLPFALFALALVAAAYLAAAKLLQSAFGRTLCGIRENEPRMKAIGTNTPRHRAIAMGFSGIIAGLAGIIAAQHTQYISPDLLFWTASGEALIVVILGGLGTLVGPLIGAVAFVMLKHEISNYTDHWHIIIGFVLIVTVLAGGRGIFGAAEQYINPPKRPESHA